MEALFCAGIIFFFIIMAVGATKSYGDAKPWRQREAEILRPMSFKEWLALTPAQRESNARDLKMLVKLNKRRRCRC